MLDLINKHLKDAMVSKDKIRIMSLRNIISELKMNAIKKKDSLSDAESVKVIQSMSKRLKDSIKQFRDGGRDDLVQKETEELNILKEFLPEPLSEEELVIIIETTIKEVNANDMKDMGKVMGSIISKTQGRGDGALISKIVREKLS